MSTRPVIMKPTMLTARERSHRHTFLAGLTGAQLPVPVLNHAQLRERKGDEDAHDVQLDESGGLGMESDDQRDGGEREDTMPLE